MKLEVPKFIKTAQKAVSKHSPEILTAVGIAGMATTVILAVKATPKALEQIHEAEGEKISQQIKKGVPCDDANQTKLTPVETVKATWKLYIPAAATGLASAACIIGANTIHVKRKAALLSAYELSKTAFTEYREKVKEEIGEEKEKVIREKVAEDKVSNLVFHEDGVVHTGNGNTLFFEPISKTVFRSSRNAIDKTINDLNWKMSFGNEPYMALADFYEVNNLPSYALGNELGWRTDKGLIEVSYVPATTDTGEPCLSIDFLIPPEWDFDSLY